MPPCWRAATAPCSVTEEPFHGFRVDATYHAQRLIIELDGFEYDRDRERDRGTVISDDARPR